MLIAALPAAARAGQARSSRLLPAPRKIADTDAIAAHALADATPPAIPDAEAGSSPGEAPSASRPRLAVVITQSVGVGPLADRLGAIATRVIEGFGVEAIEPASAVVELRRANGPDPLTCGSEATCLASIAEALDVRWVLAVGVGHFGGMYGLDLRMLDREADAPPAIASGTWAEPGPDWEEALRAAIDGILPPELRAPPRGRLIVRANAAGTLFVDGEEVGALPLAAPIELAAGPHAVELRGEQGRATAEVDVPRDGLAEVELALAPPLADPPSRWKRTTSYVAGGGALLALAAAIATHASAASTMDDARAQKEAGKPFAATRQDALDTIVTARVLYGLAAGLAAGAAALWFLDREPAPPPQPIAGEP